jgi:uncharacterized cysteine cluster protein YcgN (CxxCxxCC family)
MALGWLWLYSRYRKKNRQLKALEAEEEWASEICDHCGHPRFRHADDENKTCPTYD